MQIRPASIDDAADLVPLFAAWDHPLPEPVVAGILREWADTPRAAILVAEQDRVLAGMVAVSARPGISSGHRVAHLSSLVVDPALRRSGVGAALLAAAEDLARQWACGRIELSSSLSRTAAHRFYPAQGYEDTTTHHAFYGKRLPGR